MPGIKTLGAPGYPSMEVAFLSKAVKLKRIASLQGTSNSWQRLVVNTDRLRLVGIYARPRMPRADSLVLLKNLDSTMQLRARRSHAVTATLTIARGQLGLPTRRLRLHVRPDPASTTPPCAARPADFSLHTPSYPTFWSKSARGRLVESTIDLFLTARITADRLSQASLYLPLTSGGSDHAPVTITVSYPLPVDRMPPMKFRPTPRRMDDFKLREVAKAWYSTNLPSYGRRFDEYATPEEVEICLHHAHRCH